MLPDILERNHLYTSAEILKFLLGYEEDVSTTILNGALSHADWKEKLYSLPINEQFYSDLIISNDGETFLNVNLSSCNISVRYKNSIFNQMLAQQMIAAIELIIVTLDEDSFITLDGGVIIEVRNIEDGVTKVWSSEDSNSLIIIEANPQQYSADIAWQCIANVIGIFMAKSSLWKQDTRDIISEKQAKENIMDRFSSLLLEQPNIYEILGENFKYTIDRWKKSDDKLYIPKIQNISLGTVNDSANCQIKEHHPKRLHVSSSVEWWDKAKWGGVGFFSQENRPPILTLAFDNLEYGKKIFEEWNQLYTNNSLRIKIYFITGFDKFNPQWYRVSIVPDIFLFEQNKDSTVKSYTFSRSSTMNASTLDNMYRFRSDYLKYNCCWLMPSARGISSKLDYQHLAVPFFNIEFREAWTIGIDDQAIAGLRPGDSPIIPTNHEHDAPVLDVLNWFLSK